MAITFADCRSSTTSQSFTLTVPPPQKRQAKQSKAGGDRLRKKLRQAGSITAQTRLTIIIVHCFLLA